MRHRGALLLATLVFFGAGQVVLAHAPYFWLAVVCVMFINIMAAAADILHMALLQHSVANEQRGRAMGAWVVGIGTAPVGHLEIGYLAGVAGARLALLFNGVALMVLAGALRSACHVYGVSVCCARLAAASLAGEHALLFWCHSSIHCTD
jgi:MFS family permease